MSCRYDFGLKSRVARDRLRLAGRREPKPGVGSSGAEEAPACGFAGSLASAEIGIRIEVDRQVIDPVSYPIHLSPVVG